mgnify:CR=1 FL=1
MAIHDPFNPDVQDAYKAMNDETFEQWQFVKATGVKIEMIKEGQSEPYPNGSKDMLSDLHNNNHMWVYPTDSGFGTEPFTQEDIDNNPLLAKTGEIVDGQDLRYNDLFRIVHDYFGHGLEGATFSSRGEENAWQAHVRMYSPLAAKARAKLTDVVDLPTPPFPEATATIDLTPGIFIESGPVPAGWCGAGALAF